MPKSNDSTKRRRHAMLACRVAFESLESRHALAGDDMFDAQFVQQLMDWSNLDSFSTVSGGSVNSGGDTAFPYSTSQSTRPVDAIYSSEFLGQVYQSIILGTTVEPRESPDDGFNANGPDGGVVPGTNDPAAGAGEASTNEIDASVISSLRDKIINHLMNAASSGANHVANPNVGNYTNNGPTTAPGQMPSLAANAQSNVALSIQNNYRTNSALDFEQARSAAMKPLHETSAFSQLKSNDQNKLESVSMFALGSLDKTQSRSKVDLHVTRDEYFNRSADSIDASAGHIRKDKSFPTGLLDRHQAFALMGDMGEKFALSQKTSEVTPIDLNDTAVVASSKPVPNPLSSKSLSDEEVDGFASFSSALLASAPSVAKVVYFGSTVSLPTMTNLVFETPRNSVNTDVTDVFIARPTDAKPSRNFDVFATVTLGTYYALVEANSRNGRKANSNRYDLVVRKEE